MEEQDKEQCFDVLYRKPRVEDGKDIYQLVKDLKTLDLNSIYSYLLICTHFSDTSIVVLCNNEIAGFISGYLVPGSGEKLFIWQVGVRKNFHGYGLATSMVINLLKRPSLKGVLYIEATVTPSNGASKSFFRSLAEKMNTVCSESLFFGKTVFGGFSHEEEALFSIGPLEKNRFNEFDLKGDS